MKCVVCKMGEIGDGKATVTLVRKGATFVFQDVPAMVCENCGEEYISEEVTRRLMIIAEEAFKSGVHVDVRHYVAA